MRLSTAILQRISQGTYIEIPDWQQRVIRKLIHKALAANGVPDRNRCRAG